MFLLHLHTCLSSVYPPLFLSLPPTHSHWPSSFQIVFFLSSNFNTIIGNHIFQINDLSITCPGINFILRYSHFKILHVLIVFIRLYRLLQCSVSLHTSVNFNLQIWLYHVYSQFTIITAPAVSLFTTLSKVYLAMRIYCL